MKKYISTLLRKLRLLYFGDKIRFYYYQLKNKQNNNDFVKKHPDVKLPPDYLIYESFQMSYQNYYENGYTNANELVQLLKKHTELKNKKILDWGCGPARIIRHLPKIINNNCQFYGTDYNKKSIHWCTNNLPGIHFNHNTLQAQLPYNDNFFDIIYGLSVLTHLSEKMHYEWINELTRILKPGGIILLTTQGKNFTRLLIESELKKYQKGEIVVRGNVKEGHRTFSAFHPTEFMKHLFTNLNIVEHIVRKPTKNWFPQDIWIAKK